MNRNLQPAGATFPVGNSGRIQAVSRAVRLLMLVASGETDATAKELAKAASISTPTAHHLLSTLVYEGVLAKDSKARYLLGTQVAVLADALQRAVTAPEYLLEPLRQLAATTGETSYVAAWRQGEIRVWASVEGHHSVRVSLPLGPYTDAHARATGKLLLALTSEEQRNAYLAVHPLRPLTPRTIVDARRLKAEFEQIRENGYALDEEEFLSGVSCVSAAVVVEEVVVAAYSVSVPTPRFQESRLRLVDAVLSVTRAGSIGAAAHSSEPGMPAAGAQGSQSGDLQRPRVAR
ncbi:MAG: IclR family transcriptional regulator [Acidimicrobiales bacterium]